ncbi:methionine adenosyltransferase [Candidatus Avelusimicrobium faecicola]|uniref:methionine adenosyltransferase n=1 Tax=Candidatus Avelusimicrobium faecicola TaxID=3416205 RepID=UPI002A604566|nr:methionine adenosyltransferase [Spirochaetota bacterium]MDE3277394.1 methionine adenosyltransferase [Spirochaetota bacterium]MDY2939619.1 methionine adenosyltransferase [Elusimicrobiaceae bacterium]MDY6128420.1 methionine adenosyltransferase [Elusimicrobiaceae bacterium]
MIRQGKFYFTSESVSKGHPDKVCDQISDAVLDAILAKDKTARVACETYITRGLVVVGGEITTRTWVDVEQIARQVIKDIGYTEAKFGFNGDTCAVVNVIGKQSPDISQGVDVGGAGDQGLMVGYAVDETLEYMPLSLVLANNILKNLEKARKEKTLPYLGPDAKSQVTVEYVDGKPVRVDTIVLSTQHTPEILDKTGTKITEKSKREIETVAILPIVKKWIDKNTKIYINPTGKFVIGGPQSDTGLTGRKIIVDTYGGRCPHGGGAFSGKDPTKVDRSAAYMARYIAKNIVAAKLASECTVQIAYAIGRDEPVGFYVDTDGTGKIADEKLAEIARKIFPLTPRGIIEHFKLRNPIYLQTAAYGHFGRKGFPWEATDKVAALLKAVK